ncbi:MAG: SPOR domain-containing protein [Gemmatimonadales bacterium]
MRVSIIGCLAGGALAVAAAGAAAQTDPRLVDAVRAAQEGQSDSARATVDRLLAATPPADTLYPQILYTLAMVAGTAGDMRHQLQRVAVEYGTSPWADDALLRLVQMDYATRNFDGAARNLERLRLDFPSTPLLAQAAYWAGRTYFDANNPTAACRWLTEGMAQAGGDVELQNRLAYLHQRCGPGKARTLTDSTRADSGAIRTAADSTRPDSGAIRTAAENTRRDTAAVAGAASAKPAPAKPAPVKPAPPARTVYRVQIAAVATRKGAEDEARKARPLGLTVLTVEEKGLFKVRLGEYPTREAAQNAAASLKAKLGGSPFVVAEP